MGPVGGLVSARGAKPGDLAGTLGLSAAPFGPNCDPPLSQWTFSQRIKKIISSDLPNCKAFFVVVLILCKGS